MKKLISLIICTILSLIIVYAQAPQAFNYIGLALDHKLKEISNKDISVRATITDDIGGSYEETHNVTTDSKGFFSIKIGGEFPGSISGIAWDSEGPKSLVIAISIDGGFTYDALDAVELSAVPYAIYGEDADANPENELQELSFDQNTGTLSITDGNDVPLNSLTSDITLTELQQMFSELISAMNANHTELKGVLNSLSNTVANIDIAGGNVTTSDIDGNVYPVVKIGDQIWMAQNLKTTKYNDGTDIQLVEDGSTWESLSTPAYCWYSNFKHNFWNYGAIYNWYTVETGNLCPTDWHVPSLTEWLILADYLGGATVAGGKLKETGTTHWDSPNEGATNETGFTALPGGFRDMNDGIFKYMGGSGWWWSATEQDGYARILQVYEHNDVMGYGSGYPYKAGLYVRCVKD